MMGWEAQISVVIVITILAVISPGPDFAMTLRNSLVYGRKAGLATSFGIAAGVSVHILYSILGFSFVLEKAVWLLEVIRYLGAAYLIWLGLQPFLKRKNIGIDDPTHGAGEQGLSGFSAFRSGFLCNALNPKTTMFFVALFSQVIHPETPIYAQISFGIMIAFVHLAWFAIVATMLTHPRMKMFFDKAKTKIEKGIGLCLVGLGVRLAIS